MDDAAILRLAEHFRDSGADLIDLGCIPGESWGRVGEVTRMLVDRGFRVSIDSFDRREVEDAVAAGAELVLSCNSTNIDWAEQLDVEFVLIPDAPFGLDSLAVTIERLQRAGYDFNLFGIRQAFHFQPKPNIVGHSQPWEKGKTLEYK